MKNLKNLLCFLRDNAISLNGRFLYIDVAPYEDELELLQQAHRSGWEQCQKLVLALVENGAMRDAIGDEFVNDTDALKADIANMEYKEEEI